MMAHPNLRTYVENRINYWRRLSNQREMTFPLSHNDAKEIIHTLECDLSPENLHCDGEISNAEAQEKYDYYMRVHEELGEEIGYYPGLEY
jgi:hypothetical protein